MAKQASAHIFIQRGEERTAVPSLAPYLEASLQASQCMDQRKMHPASVQGCRWVGYGIGKGVTHPRRNITVFAIPQELTSGLHGDLVQGFDEVPVDPTPFCYESSATIGFGGFVRWVLFADPKRTQNILGIDFSLVVNEHAGVATTVLRILQTVETIACHGIASHTEIALLNTRMREPHSLFAWRKRCRLLTLQDWLDKGPILFQKPGIHCPRCGLRTLNDPTAVYCSRCGCKPTLIWDRYQNTDPVVERS